MDAASTGIGLYIHVPFCESKCPYCDFYSMRGTEARYEEYTNCIISRINNDSIAAGRRVDTLYFGGGTPSLLGAGRLSRIIGAAKKRFSFSPGAEITVEANPGADLGGFFETLQKAGANRLSLGLQSANEGELRELGRRHTAQQAFQAVKQAQQAGFSNISLDLMLAVPGQTQESLCASIEACARAGVRHISAYLLKIEPRTAYYKRRDSLCLPGEDETCELYLTACRELEKHGFLQYEISNFAQPGFEGRHNLNYWNCGEYWGLGPAAHSCLNGARFYYGRDLRGFLAGAAPTPDPDPDLPTGGFAEYAMLALRLRRGLTDSGCLARFGSPIPEACRLAALRYEPIGLTQCGPGFLRLTPRGFLVSNALLSQILDGQF